MVFPDLFANSGHLSLPARSEIARTCNFEVGVYASPDPFLCRIIALTGSISARAGVNPADQRWGWWSLLPLRMH